MKTRAIWITAKYRKQCCDGRADNEPGHGCFGYVDVGDRALWLPDDSGKPVMCEACGRLFISEGNREERSTAVERPDELANEILHQKLLAIGKGDQRMESRDRLRVLEAARDPNLKRRLAIDLIVAFSPRR